MSDFTTERGHYADHDLLVRISVIVDQIRMDADRDRKELATREARAEAQLTQYKSEIEKRFAANEGDIESLKTSRTKFMAVATAMSATVGLIIKFLWPGK